MSAYAQIWGVRRSARVAAWLVGFGSALAAPGRTIPQTADPAHFHPGYYARVWPADVGNDGTAGDGFNFLLDTPLWAGAVKGYEWRRLETKPGVYDFSPIEADIAALRQRRRQLFIEVHYTAFNDSLPKTPKYMWTNAIYSGDPGRYGNYARYPTNDSRIGWMPVLWNANVKARYHALIAALSGLAQSPAHWHAVPDRPRRRQ